MTNYAHNYQPDLLGGALIQAKEIEGGTGAPTYSTGTPSGVQNGVNVTFTLPSTPSANSLHLYLNGQFLTGGGVDYTLVVATITMITPPLATDIFTYLYS